MGVEGWVWLTRLTGGDSPLLCSWPEAEPGYRHLGIGFVSSGLQAGRRGRREGGREERGKGREKTGVQGRGWKGEGGGGMGERRMRGSRGERQA